MISLGSIIVVKFIFLFHYIIQKHKIKVIWQKIVEKATKVNKARTNRKGGNVINERYNREKNKENEV